jgi:hypothetical protein
VIKTSTDKTEASLQRYKELLEQKLKDVAQAVAYTAAKSFVQHTPVGDTDRYRDLYKLRYDEKGYKIEAGLARGSWVLSLNNQVNQGAVDYDTEGINTVKKATSTLQGIKLGDVIIINNSLDYISFLEDGKSSQQPLGIRLPAIDQIKQASKLDIQRVLTETKFKAY